MITKKWFCSLMRICIVHVFLSGSVQANILPYVNFPTEKKVILVSNLANLPIISTEVSGSRCFSMVSGGDQILLPNGPGYLEFTIDTVKHGCFYMVTVIFSNGDKRVVHVDLCQEGKDGVDVIFNP